MLTTPGAPPSKFSAVATGVSLPSLPGSEIGSDTGLPSTQTRQRSRPVAVFSTATRTDCPTGTFAASWTY